MRGPFLYFEGKWKHMDQLKEHTGNFGSPLLNIPQSHMLVPLIAPIPVAGGDAFQVALDAGSIESMFLFITHCAFDHQNSFLDWIPSLSGFGNNSSISYGLQ